MELASTILIAFGGGVFGTLIGGTTAFIFTGLLGLIGIAVSLAGGGDVILNEVAFGPFFGPHVAFVGSVAGAALAGRMKLARPGDVELSAADAHSIMSGGATQEGIAVFESGADTTIPLFRTESPLVLLIGGVFGVLGYFLNSLFVQLALPIDTVALTVLTFGVIVRLTIGSAGLIGAYPKGEARFPFTARGIAFLLIWSFTLSAVIGHVVIKLNMNNIGFAISAFSLIFLYFKLQFPVSHHVTMVAGYAGLAFGSIWAAALFGALAALAGEFIQRAVNTHVDSHWDMPATVIAPFSALIFLLAG